MVGLRFKGSGTITEARELTSQKTGKVWRRLVKLAYQGATAELICEPEIYSKAAAGLEVEVEGECRPDDLSGDMALFADSMREVDRVAKLRRELQEAEAAAKAGKAAA